MSGQIHRHYKSFRHACRGISEAVRYHPNFRIHLILSAIALAGAVYFDFTRMEIVLVVFTIILGLSAEMINTSLESMTDLITKEWREEARVAKDVSAGMMLLVSVGAAIIAGILFIPRFLNAINVR